MPSTNLQPPLSVPTTVNKCGKQHFLSFLPNFSKMSRSGKGGLKAQGHSHLIQLTASQLVVVPWSSHAERNQQSAGDWQAHRLWFSWHGSAENGGSAEQQICYLSCNSQHSLQDDEYTGRKRFDRFLDCALFDVISL